MQDLKKTLLMPKTGFEMRGNLTQKEPAMLTKWDQEDLYGKMNANRQGCEEFLLHDGPPYANGDIHCGHMLNRLLKDFTIRYKNMEGYKTPFVFGWDTHGLPIEIQVTKSGIDRKTMAVADFRTLCRDYALKQIDRQKGQIHRLGCLGDYAHPYLTLAPEYEARQIDVFAAMALQGIIYKGVKPVYWSPSSESALAEAEVEYRDVAAKTLYVAFDVADGRGVVPSGSKIAIWTTTPWTIPANLAISLNPRLDYGLFRTDKGDFIFLASLAEKLKAELGFAVCEPVKVFKGQALEYATAKHPLYERLSTVILADFVTEESGTGCVHTAPDHGLDDFNACAKYGLKPFGPVDEKGIMHLTKGDPCDGLFYEDANDVVIKELAANGHLLKEDDITHSYPHDWRTHKPVIFRATPQWFCSIEPIRKKLLEEVRAIEWEPKWGEEKMESMIRDRADWCISRQRAWGVPIPIIYNEDGSPIIEAAVFKHIRSVIAKEGSNGWFTHPAAELLPDGYANPKSPHKGFRKETDIMDVWFDSGSSWNGALRERGLKYPADLYLEGNDQYRGWFNSSLILSTAYEGMAPFKACVTHGWVMDENWQKMSKSAGNGIDPTKVANQYGADLLRLWAATVNYEADVRISESIIASVAEQYRKIRNTFKFMLGNLQDGEAPYAFPSEKPHLWPVDEWILSELEEAKNVALNDYDAFAFASVTMELTNLLVDLSGFYLDMAKDVLYCDEPKSKRRKAIQYVIYKLTYELCLLYNPILSFTMDEVYSFIPGVKEISPQLEDMPHSSKEYGSDVRKRFASFRKLRDLALKALEERRAEGVFGDSSEAVLELTYDDADLVHELSGEEPEERARLFGVSGATIAIGAPSAKAAKATGPVCDRCRLAKEDVETEEDGAHLCQRCAKAMGY
jgi:isoleucyl-tRNA synthetase